MLRERLVLKVELPFDDVSDYFQLRIAWKRYFATKHNVQYDSQRPDVDLLVIVLQEHFWSDVIWLKRVTHVLIISDLPTHSLFSLTQSH